MWYNRSLELGHPANVNLDPPWAPAAHSWQPSLLDSVSLSLTALDTSCACGHTGVSFGGWLLALSMRSLRFRWQEGYGFSYGFTAHNIYWRDLWNVRNIFQKNVLLVCVYVVEEVSAQRRRINFYKIVCEKCFNEQKWCLSHVLRTWATSRCAERIRAVPALPEAPRTQCPAQSPALPPQAAVRAGTRTSGRSCFLAL